MEQPQINTDAFEISLTLNAATVNVILAALGAQPHDAVRQTIDLIVSQAQPQFETQFQVEVEKVEVGSE